MLLKDKDAPTLLKDVLPLFSSDLLYRESVDTPHAASLAKENLQNFQDLFRNEVGMLDLTLDPECDLPLASTEECLRIIQVVLNLLESLLSNQPSQPREEVGHPRLTLLSF
jgi:hypothetical protein